MAAEKKNTASKPERSGWYVNERGELCNDAGCIRVVASKDGFAIEFDDDAEACDGDQTRQARRYAAEAAMSGNVQFTTRKRA